MRREFHHIDIGAVEARDAQGISRAKHRACRRGAADTVRILQRRGADTGGEIAVVEIPLSQWIPLIRILSLCRSGEMPGTGA